MACDYKNGQVWCHEVKGPDDVNEVDGAEDDDEGILGRIGDFVKNVFDGIGEGLEFIAGGTAEAMPIGQLRNRSVDLGDAPVVVSHTDPAHEGHLVFHPGSNDFEVVQGRPMVSDWEPLFKTTEPGGFKPAVPSLGVQRALETIENLTGKPVFVSQDTSFARGGLSASLQRGPENGGVQTRRMVFGDPQDVVVETREVDYGDGSALGRGGRQAARMPAQQTQPAAPLNYAQRLARLGLPFEEPLQGQAGPLVAGDTARTGFDVGPTPHDLWVQAQMGEVLNRGKDLKDRKWTPKSAFGERVLAQGNSANFVNTRPLDESSALHQRIMRANANRDRISKNESDSVLSLQELIGILSETMKGAQLYSNTRNETLKKIFGFYPDSKPVGPFILGDNPDRQKFFNPEVLKYIDKKRKELIKESGGASYAKESNNILTDERSYYEPIETNNLSTLMFFAHGAVGKGQDFKTDINSIQLDFSNSSLRDSFLGVGNLSSREGKENPIPKLLENFDGRPVQVTIPQIMINTTGTIGKGLQDGSIGKVKFRAKGVLKTGENKRPVFEGYIEQGDNAEVFTFPAGQRGYWKETATEVGRRSKIRVFRTIIEGRKPVKVEF